MTRFFFLILPSLLLACLLSGADAPAGWTTWSPRPEAAPTFDFDPKDGPTGKGAFLITSDSQEGRQGRWTRSLPIKVEPAFGISAEFLSRSKGRIAKRHEYRI